MENRREGRNLLETNSIDKVVRLQISFFRSKQRRKRRILRLNNSITASPVRYPPKKSTKFYNPNKGRNDITAVKRELPALRSTPIYLTSENETISKFYDNKYSKRIPIREMNISYEFKTPENKSELSFELNPK